MKWTLVGYFPKLRVRRLNWVSPYADYPNAGFPVPAPVEEICSVSSCIANGPTNPAVVSINEFGGHASPADAMNAVPLHERSSFAVSAFFVADLLFDGGQATPLDFPALDLATLPRDFEKLGYDAVELCSGCSIGCSPLSCNNQTAGIAVNLYCLVDTELEAEGLARGFSLTKPEPGPYCIFEVWRELSAMNNDRG